jgi:hypothetical protein
MTYKKLKNLTPENFKRLCGVRKETFEQMVQLLEKNAQTAKSRLLYSLPD